MLLVPACKEDAPPTKPDTPTQAQSSPPANTGPPPATSDSGSKIAATPPSVTSSADPPPERSGDVVAPSTGSGATPPPTSTVVVQNSASAAPDDPPPPPPTGPTAGQPWTLTASAAPDSGYKCNKLYPHKFSPSGGSNATVAGKPRGSCAGKNTVVSIPFTPQSAGPGTVAGTFKYGICATDGTNCVLRTKSVSLKFTAAAAP